MIGEGEGNSPTSILFYIVQYAFFLPYFTYPYEYFVIRFFYNQMLSNALGRASGEQKRA